MVGPAMHHGAMSTDGNLGSLWDGNRRMEQLVGMPCVLNSWGRLS